MSQEFSFEGIIGYVVVFFFWLLFRRFFEKGTKKSPRIRSRPSETPPSIVKRGIRKPEHFPEKNPLPPRFTVEPFLYDEKKASETSSRKISEDVLHAFIPPPLRGSEQRFRTTSRAEAAIRRLHRLPDLIVYHEIFRKPKGL